VSEDTDYITIIITITITNTITDMLMLMQTVPVTPGPLLAD